MKGLATGFRRWGKVVKHLMNSKFMNSDTIYEFCHNFKNHTKNTILAPSNSYMNSGGSWVFSEGGLKYVRLRYRNVIVYRVFHLK